MLVTMASLCVAANVALGQSRRSSPQPSPELQSLTKALAGRWATTYAFTPPSPTAADSTGRGEEVWRPGPGGFTLLEEEHISTASRDEFLIAIQWWDSSAHRLRGMLCNNSGPSTCDVDSYTNSTLTWDGRQLVIDLRFSRKDKRMVWHEVWSDITPTSFTQTGDVGEVGGTLTRVVAIRGTRVPEGK
ncbi:MAG TPA: hypothetical protein VEI06_07215 [Gemmatimonadaceae bacterium]|nr:hypothetical protein [Gemmatimonadaceae bacterium]